MEKRLAAEQLVEHAAGFLVVPAVVEHLALEHLVQELHVEGRLVGEHPAAHAAVELQVEAVQMAAEHLDAEERQAVVFQGEVVRLEHQVVVHPSHMELQVVHQERQVELHIQVEHMALPIGQIQGPQGTVRIQVLAVFHTLQNELLLQDRVEAYLAEACHKALVLHSLVVVPHASVVD